MKEKNRAAETSPEPGWPSWLPILALLGFALGLMVWSWRKWPDPAIDFGREIYIPWAITQGKVLYRDIEYYNGPFSPYLNWFWFRLFHPGLIVLALANAGIFAAIAALLYRIIDVIADRKAAFWACFALLGIFGFNQIITVGSYNFICPYAHELTHGTLLALVALWSLYGFITRRIPWLLAASGLCSGLLFLTKMEYFAAGFPPMCAMLLYAAGRPESRNERARIVLLFAASMLAPILAAFFLLSQAIPPGMAFKDILGGWNYVFLPDIMNGYFMRASRGADNLSANIQLMALWSGGLLLAFSGWAALDIRLGPSSGRAEARRALVIQAGLIILGIFLVRPWQWVEMMRSLPVFSGLILIFCGWNVLGPKSSRASDPRALLAFSYALFAVGLLPKIFFHTKTFHFGFAMAMPAALLCVAALVSWVPEWIRSRGGSGDWFRRAACCGIILSVSAHLVLSQLQYRQKTIQVAAGDDAFWVDDRGSYVQQCLELVLRQMRPDQTLTVFVEGAMINYLSRRINSSRYCHFVPFVSSLYGENAILADLKRSPADFVFLIHRETPEFGLRFFGRDYDQRIYQWVMDSYTPRKGAGALPFQSDQFGILFMQRKMINEKK